MAKVYSAVRCTMFSIYLILGPWCVVGAIGGLKTENMGDFWSGLAGLAVMAVVESAYRGAIRGVVGIEWAGPKMSPVRRGLARVLIVLSVIWLAYVGVVLLANRDDLRAYGAVDWFCFFGTVALAWALLLVAWPIAVRIGWWIAEGFKGK